MYLLYVARLSSTLLKSKSLDTNRFIKSLVRFSFYSYDVKCGALPLNLVLQNL
nr:MAG TPA: hypothetical protein [Caudoviricetes sp.]